ncbi:MAG: AAA family ATPase, partial [Candidatus Melainabacteria bacterium]|nr:AAA family ATPase [Candidatus Melainabacteria bacterium]
NGWVRNSQKSDIDSSVTQAIESLGDYFSDKLLAPVLPTKEVVRSAVEKISTGEISDALDTVDKVKTAIVKLVTSEQHSNLEQDSQNNSKRTIRGFTLALEGLCSRADVSSEKVVEVCDAYINLLKEPSGKYTLLDDSAKESMRLLLVRNWKAPVKDYKVDVKLERTKEYRLGLYQVMKATVADTSRDFLYLRTPISQVPANLQEKAKELREALVEAYGYEVDLHKVDIGNYSESVAEEIKKILELSPEISQSKWSQKARDQEKIAQENQLRLTTLRTWAVPATYMPEADLQTSFEQMSLQNQELVEGLDKFKDLYLTNDFVNEDKLNQQLTRVLDLTGLDSKVNNANLSEKNSEKGHFFFRYFNHLAEKKITVEGTKKGPLKNYISATNRDRILRTCQTVVHNKADFPSTARDYSFYTKPLIEAVPGQALLLHHKLTKCFKSDGYIDVHGLKPLVIENALQNLSPSGSETEKIAGGFVLSGPAGTGKSSFADAVSGQMALPVFKLNAGTVKAGTIGGIITYESRGITVGEFFDIVKANSPCVLLLDDVDKYLIPRKADAGCVREPSAEETELTTSFLESIQQLRDQRGASRVVLIATTNLPHSSSINIALIDGKGECEGAQIELFKHVSSTALRPGRFDHPVFSFHRLYNADQGKEFAVAFF